MVFIKDKFIELLKNKKSIKEIKIFPLSPQNNLAGHSNYDVYKEFLIDVLKEKRIRNIAITGNFGIGKTSILQTFCKEEKRSLYIFHLRNLIIKKMNINNKN